ncbi:MAG: hypothetical protein K0V04_21720 [Deltaproteobacteria bacterium]|nr:hypothetical protein [Deltaproteobacteria bacterium]
MTTPPMGLTFNETLTGGWQQGQTEPAKGAIEGAHTPLSIHNVITIDDLDRFEASPQHVAQLAVTLDFAPWGEGLVGRGGTFNLFATPDDAHVKEMIYRFTFDHDEKPHYFEGRKFIHDGSSLAQLLFESTHLFSRIYEGTDASGPVVGAGVIHIGVLGTIALVRSMRVTHAQSALDEAKALTSFGEFFLGELWHSYRAHR